MMKCLLVNRDVSGVELLMNNHQSLKAEIDAREENFTICINLGKDLLERKHYRSEEVGSSCRSHNVLTSYSTPFGDELLPVVTVCCDTITPCIH